MSDIPGAIETMPPAPGRTVDVRVRYLDPLLKMIPPDYSTADSAGLDLRACIKEEEAVVEPGCRLAVPTGMAMEISEPGLAGFVFSRSGLGAKRGLTVAQGVGVIDPDYRGEIVVWLLNTSDEPHTVRRGQRIAQLVLLPYFRAGIIPVEELGETTRGGGGFGHTGDL